MFGGFNKRPCNDERKGGRGGGGGAAGHCY